MKTKYILTLLYLFTLCRPHAYGQEVPKGLELTEILKIAATYRQAPFLSFNIRYTYSDSARQNKPLEELTGSYKIHEGKYWAYLDSVEQVQGNVYNIAIYYGDSTIIVSSPAENTDLLRLPVMDSMFRAVNVAGMAVSAINDSMRLLKMNFLPQSAFSSYELVYNVNTYLVSKIKYFMKKERADGEEEHHGHKEGSEEEAVHTPCIAIEFSGYSDQTFDTNVFNEDHYLASENGQLLPAPAFKGFRIISNNQ